MKLHQIKLLLILLFIGANAFAQDGWVRQYSGTSQRLRKVFFIDENKGWIVGEPSESGQTSIILKTTDGGETWTRQSSGTGKSLWSVFFVDSSRGWVVGAAGTILTTSDGGDSWKQRSGEKLYDLYDVFFIDGKTGWVGGTGVILKTMNSGKDWILQAQEPGPNVFSIFFMNSNLGWAVGDHSFIRRTLDGGANWEYNTYQRFDDVFHDVFFIDDNIGWTVGYAFERKVSLILKTTNCGRSWENQDNGNSFRILYSVHFANPQTGWIVGEKGVILHTTDGGTTWTAQASGTSNWLFSVRFINDKTGWAVGDNGTILKTTSGGSTKIENDGNDQTGLPDKFELLQNYPNPFNSTTTILFRLPKTAFLTMKIYDLQGSEIETLISGQQPAGIHQLNWNAKDVPSGIYFCRLATEKFSITRKIILQK